ncbi:hypothetical protein CIK00_00400 [Photobacterium carnosum]|uniref:Uncharacterized protein n=1 Tax=Photobacterium carnosum TaxID=2023717 RepID=A0A2N4UWV1_9GAMM|nr:hypothetical protein CIK00_00400 [Photobacterium carnosum]
MTELLGVLEDLNPLLFYLLHHYFYANEKKPLINSGFLKCGGAAWGIRGFEPAFILLITSLLLCKRKKAANK